jgi:steroid 5-alpha reductase family enzyme
MLNTFLLAGAAILLLMAYVWLISLRLKDSSIIDPFWGLGFLLVNFIYFAFTPGGLIERKILLLALVNLWALRLSIFLYLRNRGKGEDKRYAAWRKEAGAAWWWRSFFVVFLLQGALMWVISLPLLLAQARPAALNWLDWAAVSIWAIGFFFEAVADWQLAAFKADKKNKGKVMDRGLWWLSRHPNYFGESLIWWGFGLLAAAAGTGWGLLSSALMMFLLLRVSGVTLLERDLKQAKPGYKEYIKRTSAFVPWPPKQ